MTTSHKVIPTGGNVFVDGWNQEMWIVINGQLMKMCMSVSEKELFQVLDGGNSMKLCDFERGSFFGWRGRLG